MSLASSARGSVCNARAGLLHPPEPDSTLPRGSGPSPAERIESPQPETVVQCPGNISSDPFYGTQTQNTDSRQHLPDPSTIAIMSVLRDQSTSNADSIWRDKAFLAVNHMLQSFIFSAQALEDMISVSPVTGSMRMLIAVAPDSGHGTSNGGIILWNSIEGTSLPSVSLISGSGLAPSLDVNSVQDGVDITARNMSCSMRPQLETTGNIPFLTSNARGRSVQETALRNGIDFCTTSLETMLIPQNAKTTLRTGITLDGITSTPFCRASLPSSHRGTDGGFHIPLDVPQNVAVYVEKMLLKGSGIFTHNNEQSHLSLFEMYSKLNGIALEDFVPRLFQMMKLSSTGFFQGLKLPNTSYLSPREYGIARLSLCIVAILRAMSFGRKRRSFP